MSAGLLQMSQALPLFCICAAIFRSALDWAPFLWVSTEAGICEDEDKNVFGPCNIRSHKILTSLLRRIIQFSKMLMVVLKSMSPSCKEEQWQLQLLQWQRLSCLGWWIALIVRWHVPHFIGLLHSHLWEWWFSSGSLM